MIKHIFKIIWNERKTNVLIFLQYLLVFSILWFCFDYICYMGRLTQEKHGFDIDHTYYIRMKQRNSTKVTAEEKYEFARTFEERVSNYLGVKYVSFSEVGVPYGLMFQKGQYHLNGDSTWHNMEVRKVTSAFFDVFNIQIEQGKIFDWNDHASRLQIVINPDKDYRFGNKDKSYPVEEVRTLKLWTDNGEEYCTVVGIAERQKNFFYDPYFNGVYFSMQKEDIDLANNQIAIRVSPDADHDFVSKFKKDMKRQLQIGPYYLGSITPIKELEKQFANDSIRNNINSVFSISVFLILNIFLCITGTFWFRTQARRNEMGLRIALGSSKKKLRWMMYGEAVCMLLVASIPAIYICINLQSTELLSSLGIPIADRVAAGIGREQDVVNFLFTFLFLMLISILAIWYPAKQSSNIPPAEALRDE